MDNGCQSNGVGIAISNACGFVGYKYYQSNDSLLAQDLKMVDSQIVAAGWVGVGALKPKDDSFRQLVLSPSQLANAIFDWQELNIDGLESKNFKKIRVLS